MLNDLRMILSGIGAAIIAALVAWLRGRAAGRRDAQSRTDRQTLERTEAGRAAAQEAAADPRTPEQIIRDNDGRW
ncbi:hypothetical protein [Pseudogemmobacter sonorensis]|uniref:hypothetical protein n=1 Tax=Pseudogemmobacter sonorensis TaxID=2989681 RepID=UPI00369EA846